MNEYINLNLENIDKVHKALEAKKDKEEIYNVRYSPSKNFDEESNRVYNKFLLNRDYLKYFNYFKKRNNMIGTREFKDLNINEKKQVLNLMMKSIDSYRAELLIK